MGWVKYSTVGAKAGDNLKDSSGSTLGDTAVKNAEITLNAAGYLNNIGTTEKFKNALITTKLDGTLNREKLAKTIFQDIKKKTALEFILHPKIIEKEHHNQPGSIPILTNTFSELARKTEL